MKRTLYILIVLAILAVAAPAAQALPPIVKATWVTSVGPSSADLRAEIDPSEQPTTYLFEYTTDAIYREKGFFGASKIPATGVSIAGGTVLQHTSGLKPETTYRYRAVATNANGAVTGAIRRLTTREATPVFALPDARGWEMVSPVDKNGGSIQDFGQTFGGGVFQAAAGTPTFTYTSASSFADPTGAPGAGQYVSRRGSTGWSTENVTPPAGVAGGYPESPTSGVPYQVFSADLGTALLSNGRRCRTTASNQCPVENPPLAGSEAPAGFRNYYMRDNADGSNSALLKSADLSHLALGADHFELAYVGATADLAHVVLSTCAALTVGSTEVAGVGGECNPAKQNLYEKSGSELELINTAPGAALAAQSGAISTDGSRVYWTDGTNIYLREGSTVTQIDEAQGGGGTFQTATPDGAVAYFTKGVPPTAEETQIEFENQQKEIEEGVEHPKELTTEVVQLWRYVAATNTATNLTPKGRVVGVIGTSDDGTYVYYVTKASLFTTAGAFLWRSGAITPIAPSVAADSYPPTTGTARVSADGRHLLFVSSALELTDSDTRDISTGLPSPSVFLFTAPGSGSPGTVCVSCNPFGERPSGAASLPGASPNGSGGYAPHSYKPRVLSADSNRVFFDTFDTLASQDTNGAEDVYQWEAFGTGNCAKPVGCINLISSGRAEGNSSVLDASADGSDVYFLTDGSLVPKDPGANDVYDARVGGGYPVPPGAVPCFGDACQPLPPEPEDPTPGTLRSKPSGNLPTPPKKPPLKCKKNQVKRFGKCVKKKPQKRRARR